jgi:signal transduction histidine kinase
VTKMSSLRENCAEELVELKRVFQSLHAFSNLDRLIEYVLREAIRFTDSDSGVIGLIEGKTQDLVISAVNGPSMVLKSSRYSQDDGAIQVLSSTRKPIVVSDPSEDYPLDSHLLLDIGVHPVAAIPIDIGVRIVGILCLAGLDCDLLETRLEGLMLITQSAAIAMDRVCLMDAVNRQQEILEISSRQNMKLLEDERKRIARELHDETGQLLMAAKLKLQMIAAQSRHLTRKASNELQKSIDLVERSAREIKTLAFELYPPMLHDLGLISTLRQYVESYGRRLQIQIEIDDKEVPHRLPAHIESEVYRIFQEALTNVGKHSKANHVSIWMASRDGRLTAFVEDDGVGFDVGRVLYSRQRKGGIGLWSIQERIRYLGGTCNIESKRGKGSRLSFELPIQ